MDVKCSCLPFLAVKELPTDKWWLIKDGGKEYRVPCYLPNLKCGHCGSYFLKWF